MIIGALRVAKSPVVAFTVVTSSVSIVTFATFRVGTDKVATVKLLNVALPFDRILYPPLEIVSALIVVAVRELMVAEVDVTVFTFIPELEIILLPTLNELDPVIVPFEEIRTPVPPIVGSEPKSIVVSTNREGT